MKRKVRFTFSSEPMVEPIVYNIGHQFNLVTSIHQANIDDDQGWLVLEIEGEEKDIEAAITWVTSKGVRVTPAN